MAKRRTGFVRDDVLHFLSLLPCPLVSFSLLFASFIVSVFFFTRAFKKNSAPGCPSLKRRASSSTSGKDDEKVPVGDEESDQRCTLETRPNLSCSGAPGEGFWCALVRLLLERLACFSRCQTPTGPSCLGSCACSLDSASTAFSL